MNTLTKKQSPNKQAKLSTVGSAVPELKGSPDNSDNLHKKQQDLEKEIEQEENRVNFNEGISAVMDFTDNQLSILHKKELQAELSGIKFAKGIEIHLKCPCPTCIQKGKAQAKKEMLKEIEEWYNNFGRGQCYCDEECFNKAIEELKEKIQNG